MNFKIFIILVLLGLQSTIKAQSYIDVKKSVVMKSLEYRAKQKAYPVEITSTDSTISLQVDGSQTEKFDLVLFFNAKGFCIREERQYYCEDCFTKAYRAVYMDEFFKWDRRGTNSYASSASLKLFLFAPSTTAYKYVVSKSGEDFTGRELAIQK